MEELRARHRKEQQELQAKITQKKKTATKKTRKGVNDDCARLERELEDRHSAERAQLDGGDDPPTENLDSLKLDDDLTFDDRQAGTTDRAARTDTSVSQEPGSLSNNRVRQKKPSRQKARLARRTAEQEALATNAEQEATALPDLREQEQKAMRERFSSSHLKEVEVRPDGHCLYSAVAYQLSPPSDKATESTPNAAKQSTESYQSVRTKTADYIFKNPDEFAPYLDEPLDVYSQKVKDTAEWGGQLELHAISKAYGVEINVLQASGEIIKFERGDTASRRPIWLAYYRHHFGLGEHYNALMSA